MFAIPRTFAHFLLVSHDGTLSRAQIRLMTALAPTIVPATPAKGLACKLLCAIRVGSSRHSRLTFVLLLQLSGTVGQSVPLVPSHRRLATSMTVSNAASLIATLADPMIDTIVLTAGHYILSAELSVLRSVNIEAAVPGTVTLDAQASISSQRRVIHINPGASGFVRLLGLRITGGYRNPPVRSLPGAASASGGGVFVTSGTIDFISCKVYSNTARAAGDNADGGGIFVPGGASRSLLELATTKRASHSKLA